MIYFLLSLCVLTSVQATPFPATYKGVSKIETQISNRLLDGHPIDFSIYLGIAPNSKRTNTLLSLMGMIKNGMLRNSSPNGINFLLWYLVFDKLTLEISFACEGETLTPLNSEFKKNIHSLCSMPNWGVPEADLILSFLWLDIMGFDAPAIEMEKWKKEVIGTEAVSNKERFKFALNLIFLNPYFLMEE